jgi:hypothetical protein
MDFYTDSAKKLLQETVWQSRIAVQFYLSSVEKMIPLSVCYFLILTVIFVIVCYSFFIIFSCIS